MRYGIPAYRLPASYLDRDIDAILSTGVEVHRNTTVGQDVTFPQLREDYDSVYLAIGAGLHKSLGIPGEEAEGVLSAIQSLDTTIRSVKPDFTGKDVVVVGGGNVAMDATRTSVRLGGQVGEVRLPPPHRRYDRPAGRDRRGHGRGLRGPSPEGSGGHPDR